MDFKLFSLLNDLAGKSRFADWSIIFFADYFQYAVGLVFLGLLIFHPKFWNRKVEALVVTGFSIVLSRLVLTELIRYFIHQPRPFVSHPVNLLVLESSYSFPSGHAAFFFAAAAAIYLIDKKWGWVFFVFGFLISMGRVAGGVHYPSDILGGAAIGFLSGYVVTKFAGFIKSARP